MYNTSNALRLPAVTLTRLVRVWAAYLRLSLRDTTTYRSDIFFRMIGWGFELGVVFLLWRVLAQASYLTEAALPAITAYYVVGLFLKRLFPFLRMARDIREDIYSGDILVYQVRQIPYWIVWSSRGAAQAIVFAPVGIVVTGLLVLLTGAPVSLGGIFWFPILGVIGYIISFQIWYLIGATTFFLEENLGPARLCEHVQYFLGGMLIPLEFFPDWLRAASQFMPFQFWVYLPAKTLTDTAMAQQAGQFALLGVGWIVFLALITHVVWNRGWQHFSGNSV